jgi:fucose permease
MQAYHSAVMVIAILGGAFLGRMFASARNRNVVGWSLAGAILPATVIVLWFLKPLPAPEGDAEEAEA